VYKQFAILFLTSKIIIKKGTKREIKVYGIAVWFTKNEFGKHFVDYQVLLFSSLYHWMLKSIYSMLIENKAIYIIKKLFLLIH